jgi:hypothetical protein
MTGIGKGAFRIAIEDWLKSYDPSLFIKITAEKTGEYLVDKPLSQHEGVFNKIAEVSGMQLLKDILAAKGNDITWVTKVLMFVGILVSIFSTLGNSFAASFGKLINYWVENQTHTSRIPVNEFLRLLRLYPDKAKDFIQDYNDQGFDLARIDALFSAQDQENDLGTLIRLHLRGEIREEVFIERAYHLGYPIQQAKDYLKIALQIPSPNDLISMAVREAWSEETVSRFQYDAGLPSEFVEWMSKQGFTSDWSKRYWRQHWQLPGISQSYEMLHRLRPGTTDNPFTVNDMELLLKTADIPQYFRQRLIEISYSPYTRVDIRRMYSTHILDEAGVLKAYLDIGYDDEHAAKLTEFTTHIEAAEDKGLTKDAIITSYRQGTSDKGTSISMLKELGYDDREANFFTSLVDADQAAQQIDDQLKVIQQKFINFQVDESGVMELIGMLNLPTERVNLLLSLWNVQRLNKVAIPSKSDLESFYRASTVTAEQILDYLKKDGYTFENATRYLQRMDSEIQHDAQVERDRAQATADKLATAKIKTAQQTLKAGLDVQIAEDRLAIADCKVAAHDKSITSEQKDELANAILNLQAEIASFNLQKAQISAGLNLSA